MFSQFGQDAIARQNSHAQRIDQQRTMLDAQVNARRGGVPIATSVHDTAASDSHYASMVPRSLSERLNSRANDTSSFTVPGRDDSVSAQHPRISPVAVDRDQAADNGSPLSRHRSFGRALSEITRGSVSNDQASRKQRQQEEFAAALEAQIKEKEERKALDKARKWQEEQEELRMMGYAALADQREAAKPAGASGRQQHPHASYESAHQPRSEFSRSDVRGRAETVPQMPYASAGHPHTVAAAYSDPVTVRSDADSVRTNDMPGSSVPSGSSSPAAGVAELHEMVQRLLSEQQQLKDEVVMLRQHSSTNGNVDTPSGHVGRVIAVANRKRGPASAPPTRKPGAGAGPAVDLSLPPIAGSSGVSKYGTPAVASTASAQPRNVKRTTSAKAALMNAVPGLIVEVRGARSRDHSIGNDDDTVDSAQARAKSAARARERAAFGRRDEGKDTAAARRQRGEARLREEADSRKAVASSSKRDRAQRQQQLRSELASQLQAGPDAHGHHFDVEPAGPHGYHMVAVSPIQNDDVMLRGMASLNTGAHSRIASNSSPPSPQERLPRLEAGHNHALQQDGPGQHPRPRGMPANTGVGYGGASASSAVTAARRAHKPPATASGLPGRDRPSYAGDEYVPRSSTSADNYDNDHGGNGMGDGDAFDLNDDGGAELRTESRLVPVADRIAAFPQQLLAMPTGDEDPFLALARMPADVSEPGMQAQDGRVRQKFAGDVAATAVGKAKRPTVDSVGHSSGQAPRQRKWQVPPSNG
jgi:hypothetical protein